MPIAGNNVEVLPMQIVNKELIEYGKHRMQSRSAMDVTTALKVLRQGKMAYIKFYGSNVLDVRTALRKEGIKVYER